jgi:Thaumatin family
MFINVTHGPAANRVNRKGCVAAGCTTAVNCPQRAAGEGGGAVVGCASACARFGTDQYRCRGAWASRSACHPAQWPVDYAAVFKKAEPYAYSYADDDATSTFVCKGRCDDRITFGLTRPADRSAAPAPGCGPPVFLADRPRPSASPLAAAAGWATSPLAGDGRLVRAC